MDLITLLIYGDNIDYHLFKIAIDSAAAGNRVWFIAPEAFECIPKDIAFPDKEILKLITFIYLRDIFELLKHLNDIQSWMQVPIIIILYRIQHYIKYEFSSAAYLMCHLIDAIKYCSQSSNIKSYLIMSFENDVFDMNCNTIHTMINFYIDYLIKTTDIWELNKIIDFL